MSRPVLHRRRRRFGPPPARTRRGPPHRFAYPLMFRRQRRSRLLAASSTQPPRSPTQPLVLRRGSRSLACPPVRRDQRRPRRAACPSMLRFRKRPRRRAAMPAARRHSPPPPVLLRRRRLRTGMRSLRHAHRQIPWRRPPPRCEVTRRTHLRWRAWPSLGFNRSCRGARRDGRCRHATASRRPHNRSRRSHPRPPWRHEASAQGPRIRPRQARAPGLRRWARRPQPSSPRRRRHSPQHVPSRHAAR
jgi:hypothetical protein